MSFTVRNLMADVGLGLFAAVRTCPNSGPPECQSPSCGHDSRRDDGGTGCTHSGGPTTGHGDDEHGDEGGHGDQGGHGGQGGQGGHRQALPLLRQQLREALGAGA
jgi:hypothetical protein